MMEETTPHGVNQPPPGYVQPPPGYQQPNYGPPPGYQNPNYDYGYAQPQQYQQYPQQNYQQYPQQYPQQNYQQPPPGYAVVADQSLQNSQHLQVPGAQAQTVT